MKVIQGIILLCILFVVSCSNDPSPKGSIEADNAEKDRLRSLISRSYDLIDEEKYPLALPLLDSARDLSLLLNDTAQLSNAFNNFGWLNYKLGEFDKSIEFYSKSLELARLTGDSSNVMIRLKNIGISLKQQTQYPRAIRSYREALIIANVLQDSTQIASINNSIGNLYNTLKNYQQSLESFKRAFDMWESTENEVGQAIALGNIGNALLGLERIDEAIAQYQKSLELKQKVSGKRSVSITLNNLGEAYFLLKSFRVAREHFDQALILKQEVEDKRGIGIVSNNLAMLDIEEGRFESGQRWLNKAKQIAEETGADNIKLENYRLQKALYARTGNFQKALEVDLLYDEMRQTDFNEQVVRVNELQYEYDLDQEEQAKLAAQNERDLFQVRESEQRFRAKIQTYFIVVAVIAVILIGYFALSLRKKNRHIENLIKELHHRVKNHLGMISGMFGAQSQELPGADAALLDEAKTRVEAVNGIHRRLYREDEYEFVNMHEYLTELVDSNALVFGLFNKIEKELKINSEPMDIDKAISVGLIANEVLTNAFKYGLREHNKPVLNILLEKMTKGHRMVIFNNADPKEDKADGMGFGSELIRRLAANLKGTVHTKQENGFHFELTFP